MSSYRVRVWDLPTRLFHWLLVVCVLALFVTGHVGGNAMQWHARAGYTVLALLLFRIAWGFVGGHWSRFRSFLYAPRTVLDYVAGRAHPDHLVGHNPLGGVRCSRCSWCCSHRRPRACSATTKWASPARSMPS